MSELVTAWDPAPAIIAGAGAALLLFGRAFVRLRRRGRADHAGWSRLALFLLALACGVLPLASPLDEIGESDLLSAHMLQHVLVGDVAPALALLALRGPLLYFQLPRLALRAIARAHRFRRGLTFLLRPSVGFGVWIAALGAWHVPAAYDYALRHQLAHDAEHLSFLFAGLLVWTQIVDPARREHLDASQRVRYMLGLLGAGAVLAGVLALATTSLYPAYAVHGGALLGVSPLRDQQLAALVMIGEQLVALAVCMRFLLRLRSASATVPRRLVPARRHA